MADLYWLGTTSTDHADINNWSDTDGGSGPECTVTGTLNPDVTGTYAINSTYNSEPAYEIAGGGYWIWWYSSYSCWIISNDKGDTSGAYWYSAGSDINGEYSPYNATGTATVAASVSVPGTGDHAHFMGTRDNACTLTANWSLGDLTTLAGYTAKLDLGDIGNTVTMDDGGDVVLDGEVFDCGDATISLTNGDFDNEHVTTFTAGTSAIVMNVTGDVIGATGNPVNDITFNGIHNIHKMMSRGAVVVNGTVTLLTGTSYLGYYGGTLSLGENAVLTGNKTLTTMPHAAGLGLIAFPASATISVSVLHIESPHVNATSLPPGTYECGTLKVALQGGTGVPCTMTLPNGDYVFTGDVEFESKNVTHTLTIANDTNDPNIEIQGDVIYDQQSTGAITYTKGTGTITASLAADQDWDWGGSTVEAIEVDKSAGTLTFSGAITTASLTLTAGTLDPNGQTITTIGACTVTTGFVLLDLVGTTIECDTLTADGQDFDASGAWTLTVATSGAIANATITNCDASGGARIDASDNCIDGGFNQNIRFGEAFPYPLLPSLQGGMAA